MRSHTLFDIRARPQKLGHKHHSLAGLDRYVRFWKSKLYKPCMSYTKHEVNIEPDANVFVGANKSIGNCLWDVLFAFPILVDNYPE